MRTPSVRAVAVFAMLALAACDGGKTAAHPRRVDELPAALPMLSQTTAMNGCDPLAAEPISGGHVTIAFGGAVGERYRPRCVVIDVGGAVQFLGDFGQHPLTGGAVLDGVPVRDPRSPLPFSRAGTEATFRADRPGVYPFYCQVHWIVGMNGVVYVR